MSYWHDCIIDAFEDAGIDATDEKIDIVTSWIEVAYRHHGQATGSEVVSKNFISDESKELEKLKMQRQERKQWENSTKPCKSCTTTGISLDGWGRDQTCLRCNGEGRHK